MGREAIDAHLEEEGPNAEISESVGGVSNLSSAIRESNSYHQSQTSFLNRNEIISPSYCESGHPIGWSDESSLISSENNNHGGNNGGTSAIAGALMIVNGALGAGLLNFSSAFHAAGGVVAANIVQMVPLQLFGYIM